MRFRWRSSFCRAAPRPGKCLPVLATSFAFRPRANAPPILVPVLALRENERCWRSTIEPRRATSSTGARFTFTPTPRRLRAVAAPCLRAYVALFFAPMPAAESAGAPDSRLTWPPSWSIEISSGGAPFGRAFWSERVSARTCEREQRRRRALRPGFRGRAGERAALRGGGDVRAERDPPAELAAVDAGSERLRRARAGEPDHDVLAGQLAGRHSRRRVGSSGREA